MVSKTYDDDETVEDGDFHLNQTEVYHDLYRNDLAHPGCTTEHRYTYLQANELSPSNGLSYWYLLRRFRGLLG